MVQRRLSIHNTRQNPLTRTKLRKSERNKTMRRVLLAGMVCIKVQLCFYVAPSGAAFNVDIPGFGNLRIELGS